MIALLTGLAPAPNLNAAAEKQSPDFQEVYGLIRAHLAGVSEADLNHAAVQALVSNLAPKVALIDARTGEASRTGPALVSKSNLFDGPIGYIRVARVGEGLPEALREAYHRLDGTNDLKGVVLDLRYADGDDYGAAAATADLFLKKERPLLDLGQGLVHSKDKSNAISVPVAVLVNGQTVGASEALAAVLRESGVGLILGGRTAGQAMVAQDYPLSTGERLRLATAPIRLGDGTALSSQGVKPDITVAVSAPDEKVYFADAFEIPQTNLLATARLSSSGSVNATNRLRRLRYNEAELVRARRDGFDPDSELAGPDAEVDKPVVRDPALARALDVLKGLAVVRQSRS